MLVHFSQRTPAGSQVKLDVLPGIRLHPVAPRETEPGPAQRVLQGRSGSRWTVDLDRAFDFFGADTGAAAKTPGSEALIFRKEVYFASDSSALQTADRIYLRRLANALADVASAVWLVGRADHRGSDAHNCALARRRAEAARAPLLVGGLAEDRITLVALGKRHEPEHCGRDDECLFRSRRVEVRTTPPDEPPCDG